MYPWIRAAKVSFLGLKGSSLGFTATSRINLRVWPGDLDALVHMNNGRYLSLMDLGRLDLALRTGMVGACRQNEWMALLAAGTMRYWRPLKLFTPFQLTTRLAWWDHKWFYLSHEFLWNGQRTAQGMAKLVLKGPQGTVAPADLARAVGADPNPPPVPAGLAQWEQWEHALREEER